MTTLSPVGVEFNHLKMRFAVTAWRRATWAPDTPALSLVRKSPASPCWPNTVSSVRIWSVSKCPVSMVDTWITPGDALGSDSPDAFPQSGNSKDVSREPCWFRQEIPARTKAGTLMWVNAPFARPRYPHGAVNELFAPAVPVPRRVAAPIPFAKAGLST